MQQNVIRPVPSYSLHSDAIRELQVSQLSSEVRCLPHRNCSLLHRPDNTSDPHNARHSSLSTSHFKLLSFSLIPSHTLNARILLTDSAFLPSPEHCLTPLLAGRRASETLIRSDCTYTLSFLSQ